MNKDQQSYALKQGGLSGLCNQPQQIEEEEKESSSEKQLSPVDLPEKEVPVESDCIPGEENFCEEDFNEHEAIK